MITDEHSVTDVTDLVEAARNGQPWAWDLLVERYRPLVRAIARSHRLGDGDADDVAQLVWMRLVEHLMRLREPRALPRWISTTARNESTRLARRWSVAIPVDPRASDLVETVDEAPAVDAGLLGAEECRAVREAIDELTPAHRDLLMMLAEDPPPSYRDISARLDIPVGSIGPTRARGLARLRAAVARRGLAPAAPARPLCARSL